MKKQGKVHQGTVVPGTQCQWFLLCEKPAVTSVAHPILGFVPCCQQCADFALGITPIQKERK